LDRIIHLLVVSSDPSLHDEIDGALGGLRGARPVMRFVEDMRLGVDAARAHRPDIVIVEMYHELNRMRSFTEDVREAVPEAPIVGVHNRDMFAHDDREGPYLIEAMRLGFVDFLRQPVSSSELQDVLERNVFNRSRTLGDAGKIASFLSNKGGVGKSTTAVNVACWLARKYPDDVLLVDTSLQMGVCASMLDLDPTNTLVEAANQIDRLDETLLRTLCTRHASGLRLLAAPPDAIAGANIDEGAIGRILSIARRCFEYVIVDTFPMLDSVAVAILDVSDRIYLVCNGILPTVTGAQKLLAVLDRIGCPKERQRILFNDNLPSFPGKLRPSDVARTLGRPVDFKLPWLRKLPATMNTGEPFALKATRFSAYSRSLNRIVGDLTSDRVDAPVVPKATESAVTARAALAGEEMA